MKELDIDMVFTYVNGNDPEHIKKKNQNAGSSNFIQKYNPKIRTNNIEEIIYSVRTVIKFIPWIRKIFIVTDKQIPPIDKVLIITQKVIIIDHTKIIEKKYLPTFNSDVIESFLHNIPDLSEIFLYNNDDVMHLRTVIRDDIYKIVDDKILLKIRSNFNFNSIKFINTEFSKRIVYTANIFFQKFPKIKLIHNHHTKILRKSTLKQLEKTQEKILHEMRINKFRNDNYINYLFFAVNTDNLIHKNIIINDYREVIELHLGNKNYNPKYFDLLTTSKPKFLCLNSMNITFKEPLKNLMMTFINSG